MKLNELEPMIDSLKEELSQTAAGGEKHIKAASKRARAILNELKKNITALKQELVELDKEN